MRIDEIRSHGARAGVLAWLLVIAVAFASLIAYWSWVVLLRPSSQPSISIEGQPSRLAKRIQTRHLFGAASGLAASVSAIPDTAQMILAGIVSSGSAKHGLAVILIDGKKAVTARVGQEILPEVVLSRVAQDHVELTRRGQTINLRLATRK